jgi:hypothetical protein
MTRKLEELFNLPPGATLDNDLPVAVEEQREQIQAIDQAIDKLTMHCPQSRALMQPTPKWMNLLAWPQDSYRDLMDLGMQVDSRFASEIFSVASKHAGPCNHSQNSQAGQKTQDDRLADEKSRLDQQADKDPRSHGVTKARCAQSQ